VAGSQPGQPAVQMQGSPAGGLRQDDLLQAWHLEDDRPFVCLQGVREYHDNPGHTGDPWWLHRGAGAGRIIRLLELLSRHGTEAMHEFEYRLNIQVQGIRHQFSVETG
jgi:Predicted metal binding domain